jgi:hypothetical protein
MTLPFALPPWLPWWIPVLLLLAGLLYLLAFLIMPFSVIGLKGRLESIEMRLDEIQSEIRSLALRLPEPLRPTSDDELTLSYIKPPQWDDVRPSTRPPIPPAPAVSARRSPDQQPLRTRPKEEAPQQTRIEPRLGSPR